MFAHKIDHVRAVCREGGCFSWTSNKYQDDLIDFIFQNKDSGYGVIEVGSYKGGLSALLALVCKELCWPFFTMDIDRAAIASTISMLEKLSLADHSTVFHGTLARFLHTSLPKHRPLLMILDGDHAYKKVVEDINTIYRMPFMPYACAFHDYSLRHPATDERVSDAVSDCFGANVNIRHIGEKMVGDGAFPTKERPQEDGHYWLVPGTEGALIILPERIDKA